MIDFVTQNLCVDDMSNIEAMSGLLVELVYEYQDCGSIFRSLNQNSNMHRLYEEHAEVECSSISLTHIQTNAYAFL